jgi:cation diffusion facilitator family transporter
MDHRSGKRAALLGMTASAVLAAWKIAAGVYGNSTAAVSDGVESAGDVVTAGVVLFGLIQAERPPDEDHPYGHGRAETLAALFTGAVLFAAGGLICYHAALKMYGGGPAPEWIAAWPLAVSVVVKTGLWALKGRQGRKMRSQALRADAANDLLDAISGAVALLGLGAALYDPERFRWLDAAAGFAVGLVVSGLGVRVVRATALSLMDTMPDGAMLDQIRATALRVPGVLGIEKCFARRTGLQYHVDLHLEVDPAMTVFASHEIATEVREAIVRDLDWVAGVLVHVEPHLPATMGHGRRAGGATTARDGE